MLMEKRVHPIPFRTRKLSASSPMILHIFMWESRPVPGVIYRTASVSDTRRRLFWFKISKSPSPPYPDETPGAKECCLSYRPEDQLPCSFRHYHLVYPQYLIMTEKNPFFLQSRKKGFFSLLQLRNNRDNYRIPS